MIPPGTDLGAVQVALPGVPIIGRVDPDGRHVKLGKLEGWWDAPPAVRQVSQRAGEHGAIAGLGYYGPRVITLEVRVDGFGSGDSLAIAQRIARAIDVDVPATLRVTDETETLTADVLQEGDPLIARSGNRAVLSLSLLAPDPRRYAPPVTLATGLPATSGGRSLPITLPLSLNAAQVTGVLAVDNSGDLESRPSFTVFGPCSAFTITDSAGMQLFYPDAVDAGRRVVLDGTRREARLDGTALRFVTGTWPRLTPGANQFRFNAARYNAGSRLEMTYRTARR